MTPLKTIISKKITVTKEEFAKLKTLFTPIVKEEVSKKGDEEVRTQVSMLSKEAFDHFYNLARELNFITSVSANSKGLVVNMSEETISIQEDKAFFPNSHWLIEFIKEGGEAEKNLTAGTTFIDEYTYEKELLRKKEVDSLGGV